MMSSASLWWNLVRLRLTHMVGDSEGRIMLGKENNQHL